MYPVEVPWVQFVDPTAGVLVDKALYESIRAQVSSFRASNTPTNAISVHGIPVHPHVYGNGHICLDLLGDGWSPIHTISTVAVSLQSVLAGNDKNERPPDNNQYVSHAPLNPTKAKWDYHDNDV